MVFACNQDIYVELMLPHYSSLTLYILSEDEKFRIARFSKKKGGIVMTYIKPAIVVYDEDAIREIKANANSCLTNCTNNGCGGGSNINCGSTTFCSSAQKN